MGVSPFVLAVQRLERRFPDAYVAWQANYGPRRYRLVIRGEHAAVVGMTATEDLVIELADALAEEYEQLSGQRTP